MKTKYGNELWIQGGLKRDRVIRFDLRGVDAWVPSSQRCQSNRLHNDCDIKSCGCRCHKVLTMYTEEQDGTNRRPDL